MTGSELNSKPKVNYRELTILVLGAQAFIGTGLTAVATVQNIVEVNWLSAYVYSSICSIFLFTGCCCLFEAFKSHFYFSLQGPQYMMLEPDEVEVDLPLVKTPTSEVKH